MKKWNEKPGEGGGGWERARVRERERSSKRMNMVN